MPMVQTAPVGERIDHNSDDEHYRREELAPLLAELAELADGHPRRGALREQLITALMPVVRNLAVRHSVGYRGGYDDLVQVGAIGLINAVDRWDPERARGDLLGYVVPCVRGEMLRYFRDRTWATRVPRRLKDLGVAIRQATAPMSQQLGRAPKPSELAARLEVTVDDVLAALDAEQNRYATPLVAVDDDGDELGDMLGQVDDRLEDVEYSRSLEPLIARLPEREREILRLRFYGDMTQTQIAEEIGISQMHVSRLLSRTLSALRGALLDDQPMPPATAEAQRRPA